MSYWKPYGVCPCGFKTYAPFSSLHHIFYEVCPLCATSKSSWKIQVMRFVSDATWNPLTWWDSHWETKSTGGQ